MLKRGRSVEDSSEWVEDGERCIGWSFGGERCDMMTLSVVDLVANLNRLSWYVLESDITISGGV